MSMDSNNTERRSGEQRAADETPEDVAVLYTWANLQGAKYRDFSASRREFRAQMKHRAAEAAREAEEKAKLEAEEAAKREEESAQKLVAESHESEEAARATLAAEAAKAAQKAAQDRLEAARHAEAAAAAEAAARRAEREAAEAHAHAQMQSRRYEDQKGYDIDEVVPGEIEDPYVKVSHEVEVEHNIHRPHASSAERAAAMRQSSAIKAAVRVQPGFSSGMKKIPIVDPVPPKRRSEPAPEYAAIEERYVADEQPQPETPRAAEQPRRMGYRPDVPTEQMPAYRENPSRSFIPSPTAPARWHEPEAEPVRSFIPAMPPRQQEPAYHEPPPPQGRKTNIVDEPEIEPVRNFIPAAPARRPEPPQQPEASHEPVRETVIPPVHEVPQPTYASRREPSRQFIPAAPQSPRQQPHYEAPKQERVVIPVEPMRGPNYDAPVYRPVPPKPAPVPAPVTREPAPVRPSWLYGEERPVRPAQPEPASPQQVPDTLQHSRERVASRWFALKGVFDHSTQEVVEPQPARQKEFRIPTLAVFSLAGGTGKTSMVATLGRALSSLGEKILLTDTTSHGLLPFYFGARELRPGVVRTFSPPPGSTDAPIYLVNYELDQKGNDQATQEWVMDEIARNGQSAHRMVLDLNGSSGWLLRRLGRLNPTVIVPVAPDMNSVISLQAVEKFFHGITDAEGRPIRPNYVLNQFDSSLPLHLDVREVMRQLVGDRLLPFAIRRNPAVSEALAEGMTVIDYAPASPVAEDFMNVATWVRAATAPATSGYRGARWSER